MRIVFALMLLWVMALAARAERHTWRRVDGASYEAELSNRVTFDDSIILVDAEGQEHRIPLDQLCPEDRVRVDILRVPPLDIDILRSLKQVHYSSMISRQTRPSELLASFGVRIKQRGSGDYRHELTAEYFAIGRQIVDDRYILLARETVAFRLTEENKRRFEYESKIVVPLQDFYLRDFARRGEKYYAYLILVRNEYGQIIAHEESANWLYENHENLQKLRMGNYMDKQCIRRYPVRPKAVTDFSF